MKVTENGGGLNVFAEMPTVQEVAREQPAALYRPAGQFAQVLQSSQKLPGQRGLPVSYWPAPHAVHATIPAPASQPSLVLYQSAGHAVHVGAVSSSLNFPAAQLTHPL